MSKVFTVLTPNGKKPIEKATKQELIEAIKSSSHDPKFVMTNETTKTIKTRDILYFRESAFQSILADCVTFGFIFGGLILNHVVLHGRWYIDIFFIIVFFILSSARGSKRYKTFTNKEDLIKHVKESD